jgi:hypothetical protein
MEMQLGHERYWTVYFEDHDGGLSGFRLHRESFGKTEIAGEVIYWDATGGFTIRTFGHVLQVEIARAAIAEAEEKIKTR